LRRLYRKQLAKAKNKTIAVASLRGAAELDKRIYTKKEHMAFIFTESMSLQP
jgi:hypothetical protein